MIHMDFSIVKKWFAPPVSTISEFTIPGTTCIGSDCNQSGKSNLVKLFYIKFTQLNLVIGLSGLFQAHNVLLISLMLTIYNICEIVSAK